MTWWVLMMIVYGLVVFALGCFLAWLCGRASADLMQAREDQCQLNP